MGRHAEALAAYSSALAHDEKSQQLLQALVEAALKSNLQGSEKEKEESVAFLSLLYLFPKKGECRNRHSTLRRCFLDVVTTFF